MIDGGLVPLMDGLLTGDDVARILQVSRAFAYRLLLRGAIATMRMGRTVRVKPEDL